MTTKLKISGMSCGHCVSAVRNALESVDGVKSADVRLQAGEALVDHEPTVDVEAMVAAVTEEGYTAKAEA